MVRFLSSLSGKEANRDVFGALRGQCTKCRDESCPEFRPDTSQGEGWNAVRLLQCAVCGCPHSAHVTQQADDVESRVLLDDRPQEKTPTFSERAVERCMDSLADFVRGYLPLHGLQGETWRMLPVLLWAEATIYTLDELNEEAIASRPHLPSCEDTLIWKSMRETLQSLNLLNSRVEQELSEGKRYWAMERALCRGEQELREADVERGATGKSFDYRLMHQLALKSCGMQVDDRLMEMMKLYESLIETRDDVTDFEEDVLRNSFNVLVMLTKIHGPQNARERMLERLKKIERRYLAVQRQVDAVYRERHLSYVRQEKGGMWLWESILPRKDDLESVVGAAAGAVSSRRPLPKSNEPVYSLSDVRRAVTVLHHAWVVCGPLLALTQALPLVAPVVKMALRAVKWDGPIESLLEADGRRYRAAVNHHGAVVDLSSLEELWRLCRWRSYDTLMVLEGICEAYMVQMSDAFRALILTLDVQYCLAFDLREFRITSVRDAEGRISLCSLTEDGRQLNAALVIHQRFPALSVEASILEHLDHLHKECETLLTSLPDKITQLYHRQRDELVTKTLKIQT